MSTRRSNNRHEYHNEAQQRVLRLMVVLSGHEFNGLSPTEIAKAMDASASNVTRDLHNAREAGFAELIHETGRWRLAPKLVQIATNFTNGLDRARTQLEGISNRYTRG